MAIFNPSSTTATPVPSANGAVTVVPSAAADTLLLAANAGRLGGVIFNDSTKTLYILLAAGAASVTNFTYQADPKSHVEIPFNYTGVIRGIWLAVNGNARITEFTP